MIPSLRSAAAALVLLSAGFAGGLSVGAAYGDVPAADPMVLAQATPPAGRTPAMPALDVATLERVITAAVTAAVEKATATAVERLQRAAVPPELATLRQRLGDLDRLNSEIASIRRSLVGYAIWAAVGLFLLMVLASVAGGTLVALVFRSRKN